MDTCITNIETILDAIQYHEDEENANYVISDQDKALLTDTLERLKILKPSDEVRSVIVKEEDGNKCPECGGDTYVVHNCTNEKCYMHSR